MTWKHNENFMLRFFVSKLLTGVQKLLPMPELLSLLQTADEFLMVPCKFQISSKVL